MSTNRKSGSISCPFCEAVLAIEEALPETCAVCEKVILEEGQLIDEEHVMGRPEEAF
jgi:uncharacterized Zn finger protein (UPF0148 family)